MYWKQKERSGEDIVQGRKSLAAALKLVQFGTFPDFKPSELWLVRNFTARTYDSLIHLGDPDEEDAYEYEFLEDPEILISKNHHLRLAAFVGDTFLLEHLREPGLSQEERLPVSRTIGGIPCSGSTFEIHHRNSRTGFFVGLAEDTRSYLLGWQAGAVVSPPAREAFRDESREARMFSHWHVSSDGLVGEIWSEGPLSEGIT